MVKSATLLYFVLPLSILFSSIHFYNTSKLRSNFTNQEISVKTADEKNEVWGIDISHHQENINWQLMAEKNKPHFLILKSTEGTSLKDTKYPEYYKSAKKHDIVVGTYHFFSYRSPGKNQAQNFINTASIKSGDMIPILDVEYRRNMWPKQQIVREVKAFCAEIVKKYKVKPILYCNHNYYYKYLAQDFKDYKFWIADYQKEPRVEWVLWQHTEKARIQGINENVDRNILNPKHKLSDFVMN